LFDHLDSEPTPIMLISFDCPKCLRIAHGQITAANHDLTCPECGWNRPINDGDLQGETPVHCLVCGCQDLWRQKDFDPRLGVLIVGLAILLSTIAVAYMMPGVALIILMVFGLADWGLYLILPDRMVCYRCHARYRQVANPSEVDTFDLEVNERYRQEAIRMKQASGPSPR
jgi:hypothetical protein